MNRYFICFCLVFFVVVEAKRRYSHQPRIFGGENTDIKVAHYQVSLQFRDRHICGGSVITLRHILTAAHCVYRGHASDFTIRAGSNHYWIGGELRRVRRITRHPNYNDTVTNYDAAVLELEQPLSPHSTTIIKLAVTEPKPGDSVFVSGWGVTPEEINARYLQAASIPVIDRFNCEKILRKYNKVTEVMFCAGYKQGGKDACIGDSGGPAIVKKKQAGIVSWGKGCARKNIPGVYTNVALIRPWIIAQTQAV